MAANAAFSAFSRSTVTVSRLFPHLGQNGLKLWTKIGTTSFQSCKFSSTLLTDILNQPENQPPTQKEKHDDDDDQPQQHNLHEFKEVDKPSVEDQVFTHSIRTTVTDPSKHTVQDLTKLYTVDPTSTAYATMGKAVRLDFVKRAKALDDFAIMIREPGLECLELINSAVKEDSVATKVVLYGKNGCGKSLTFAHVLHACFNKKWFVVCPLWTNLWRLHFKEVTLSTWKVSRLYLKGNFST